MHSFYLSILGLVARSRQDRLIKRFVPTWRPVSPNGVPSRGRDGYGRDGTLNGSQCREGPKLDFFRGMSHISSRVGPIAALHLLPTW